MRRKNALIVALLATAIITSILLSGVEAQLYGGTLIIVARGDGPHLNPSLHWSPTVVYPGSQIFNALIEHDFQLNPKPDLAESFEVSENGLKYTFYLVENANWHDGEPFTSADVKFTFDEMLPLHPGGGITLAPIESVETPDDYTVVFNMKYVFPAFPNFLGTYYAPIAAKHLFEGTDILNNPYNMNPIGTGPFKFVEWVKGDHITLVRNEDYFREGKPYLDKIIFNLRLAGDTSAQMLALEKGEIDYIERLPFSAINQLQKTPGVNVVLWKHSSQSVQRLYFNLRNPILSNVKVRQAIAHAIDLDLIVDRVTFGYTTKGTSPIASYASTYNPDVRIYEYDIVKANELLDEAGYTKGTDGIRFELDCTTEVDASAEKLQEVMKEMLSEVGIKMNIVRLEEAAMIEKVFVDWDFDMHTLSIGSGPDPDRLKAIFHSDAIQRKPHANAMGYSNDRVDELFELGAITVDVETREEIYGEIQSILKEELPSIPIWESPWPLAYREEYFGLPAGVWGGLRTHLQNVWWVGGESETPAPGIPEDVIDIITAMEASISELEANYEQLDSQFTSINNKLSASTNISYASIALAIIAIIAAYMLTKK